MEQFLGFIICIVPFFLRIHSQCPPTCNCADVLLNCAKDRLVDTISSSINITSSRLPNLETIQPKSIKITQHSAVESLIIFENNKLRTISLNFDPSLVSLSNVLITDNPNLRRVEYDRGADGDDKLSLRVEELIISNNPRLRNLDIRNWVLRIVRKIDLSNNDLQYILPGTFRNKVSQLTMVDLSGNRLQSLHYCSTFDLFEFSSQVSESDLSLYIHGNEIPCDCHHQYLVNITDNSWKSKNISNRSVKIDNSSDLRCQRPASQNLNTLLTISGERCTEQHTTPCSNCVELESRLAVENVCGCGKCQTCDKNTTCLKGQCGYNQCQNGSCAYIADHNSYECECVDGYSGANCSTSPSPCYHTTCDSLQECVVDKHNQPVCITDLLSMRMKYGSRKLETCINATRPCKYLKNSVCENGYCACEDGKIAYNSRCTVVWVPCKEESICIEASNEAECGGKRLLYYQRKLFLSESDCLCYLYSSEDGDKEECQSYRIRTREEVASYTAKKLFYHFNDPVLLPIVLGSVGTVFNLGLCITRAVWKRRAKKRREARATSKKKKEDERIELLEREETSNDREWQQQPQQQMSNMSRVKKTRPSLIA